MIKRRLSFILLSVIFLVSACDFLNSKEDKQGFIIAEVGNNRLYLSDIESLFVESMTPEDSVEILDHYRTDWIISRLLLDKATAQFKDNEKINKLTNDYRESLVLEYYRQYLVKTKLDSIISTDQYQAAYNQYKNNFITPEDYYNLKIIIISERSSVFNQFQAVWNDNELNSTKLDSICAKGNTQCWLNDDLWINYGSLLYLTDTESIPRQQLKKDSKLEYSNNDNKIFIRVDGIVNAGDLYPLPMVRDELKSYILNNRKEDLLKKTSNDLYKKAIEENKIKFDL